MKLFTRRLREADPRRMLDHINYMQDALEQRAERQEKEKQETEKRIAALEAMVQAANTSEE